MPIWVFFAILAPAIATLVAFVDKFNLTSQIKDFRGMAMYSAIVNLVLSVILWSITGFPMLGFKDAILVMGTGVLTIWGAALYFWLMSIEDATKVVLYLQTIPVFTLILSFLFLHESLRTIQLIGFFMILAPTLLLAGADSLEKGLPSTKSLLLVISSNLLFAASGVLYKFIVGQVSFEKSLAYESFGWVVGGLILFLAMPSVRTAFKITTRSLTKMALTFIFLNEIIFVVSKLLSFYATSLGPVTLVSVLSGTQVFFGIAFGIILTKLLPKYFDEHIDRKSLIGKTIGAGITVLGLFLIS